MHSTWTLATCATMPTRSYLRNGFEMICHHMAWTPAQG